MERFRCQRHLPNRLEPNIPVLVEFLQQLGIEALKRDLPGLSGFLHLSD